MRKEEMFDKNGELDIEWIKKLLPHRYPFLLIDRVVSFDQDTKNSITVKKCITYNEPYFNGHFPIKSITPGVVLIETMGQAAGLFAALTMKRNVEEDNIVIYLSSIDKAKFRHPSGPGDVLYATATVMHHHYPFWKFKCDCRSEDKLIAEAEIMATAREVKD